MRIGAASIKIVAWLALAAATPLHAQVLEARIAAIRSGAGTLEQVRARLEWPRGADEGRLRLQATSLDFPVLSYKASRLDWQCPLRRAGSDGWKCAGPIRVAGEARPQQLAIEFSPDATVATLEAHGARIVYRSEAAMDARHRVRLDKVPVAWLGAFLGGLWAEGKWTGGRLDGEVVVDAPERGAFRVGTDLQVDALGLETPDGLLAAAGLKGRLQVGYTEQGARETVDARLQVKAGELLYERAYTQFPASGVAIRVQAARQGESAWTLPLVEWRDPAALVATGSGALDRESSLRTLDLQAELPDLSIARDRYFSGVLAPAGFGDLVLSGRAKAVVALREGQVETLQATLANVNAVDAKARFTFAGVEGDLAWTRGAGARASALRWDSGALFGIGLGPARFAFESAGGQLRLTAPVAVDALGGKLRLDQLRWQAPQGEAGARFQFGLGVDRLDLASLSQRLGWPAFTGTVTGSIPAARYESDVLTLDGALQMQMFDGRLTMDELVLERPFAVAPTLSADVAIEDLDLEPLTKVFGFGQITGRLDGRIDGLRLVDWAPVSFDARLQTDSSWKGKRRISQRAVRGISEVGGSGIAGGLQAKALSFFEDFGYSRIGLGCRLRENVCTMAGIGSAGDGYTIVEGSGIPRIQVVGFRRRVDWPTLVARLRAATSGEGAPIIE
jgi:hypothetical protein